MYAAWSPRRLSAAPLPHAQDALELAVGIGRHRDSKGTGCGTGFPAAARPRPGRHSGRTSTSQRSSASRCARAAYEPCWRSLASRSSAAARPGSAGIRSLTSARVDPSQVSSRSSASGLGSRRTTSIARAPMAQRSSRRIATARYGASIDGASASCQRLGIDVAGGRLHDDRPVGERDELDLVARGSRAFGRRDDVPLALAREAGDAGREPVAAGVERHESGYAAAAPRSAVGSCSSGADGSAVSSR